MKEIAGMFRIIVELDKAEETYGDSNIIIAPNESVLEGFTQASDIGTIVDMGPACFNVERCGTEGHPEIGDRIRFKQYCGYGFHEEVNGKKTHFTIINDDDFLTIVEKAKCQSQT